jgi:hypothetical protein
MPTIATNVFFVKEGIARLRRGEFTARSSAEKRQSHAALQDLAEVWNARLRSCEWFFVRAHCALVARGDARPPTGWPQRSLFGSSSLMRLPLFSHGPIASAQTTHAACQ